MTSRLPIVVLISGRGTNLQAIIDAIAGGALPVDLRAVICNEPGAPGIERAREAGYEVAIVHHRDFSARELFDAALADATDPFDPELVVLAGFMRILTPGFVRRYAGRLINIHPSLLPELPGLDTHTRAIAAGAEVHGATVHFVTGELDGGPIIAQARVPVLAQDDPRHPRGKGAGARARHPAAHPPLVRTTAHQGGRRPRPPRRRARPVSPRGVVGRFPHSRSVAPPGQRLSHPETSLAVFLAAAA